jgi:DNA end-binding protein Ku
MQQLYYPNEVRSIDEIDLGDDAIKDNELKMAIQLAEMSASDEFHPENYRDEVQERIKGLIQKKVEGEEITTAFAEEPRAQVIDLMDALRRSLGAPAPAKSTAKPAAKAAPAAKLPIKVKQERKAPKRAPREATVAKAAPARSRAR